MESRVFFTLLKKRKLLSGNPVGNISLCIILLVVFLIAGCKTTGVGPPGQDFSRTRQSPQYQKIAGGGWVSVFLNLKQPKGPEISFDLISVELQANKQKHSLLQDSLVINSKSTGRGQLFIGRNGVSADDYGALILKLRNVSISGQSLGVDGANNEIIVEMNLPSRLSVREGDSRSLFVAWDVISSIDERGEFSPVMNTTLQAIPFLSDILFVACPEIDSIYVIRTDRNWVISSLGVEGGPTYLALDQASEHLYVLTPEKSAIQVVDIVTSKIVDNIFIPSDYQPDFMTVSPDMQFAYVLDEQGKSLIKVDLSSGAIDNQIALSFQPRYALFLEWQRKLALSSSDTNSVYLFDPDSLFNNGMVPVGFAPDGLLSWNNLLVVAESGANSVSAYDLFTNQQKERANVGFAPRRLLLWNNQVYVTNFRSSSITFMLPGQLNVSGEIFFKGKPLEMAVSESRLWIYVGNGDKGGISVIDSTSNRLTGLIDLQALPVGLAVID